MSRGIPAKSSEATRVLGFHFWSSVGETVRGFQVSLQHGVLSAEELKALARRLP